MNALSDVKAYTLRRLETHRIKLEALDTTDIETPVLRGRIAELKALLVEMENLPPPVWTNASE